jgi:raffinose/stachyose/melibiose transport system substrate-binding protein
MAGNNPPDVLQYEGYENTAGFAGAGELKPIGDIWNSVKSNFNQPNAPFTTSACDYKGVVYCIPWEYDNQSFLFYNQSVLKAHNLPVPTTWNLMMSDAKTLKAAGIIPFSLADSDGWPGVHWYFVLAGQECGVATVQSAVYLTGAKWNEPCFVRAADLEANLFGAGDFPPGLTAENYNIQVSLLESGKAAMGEDGSWFYAPPVSGIGGELFPQAPGAVSDATSGWLGCTLGIPTKAAHPVEAAAFLKFFSTRANGAAWAKAGDPVDVLGSTASLPPLLGKLMNTVLPKPQIPSLDEQLPYNVGQNILYKLGQELLLGTINGKQFSDQFEAAAAKAGPGQ